MSLVVLWCRHADYVPMLACFANAVGLRSVGALQIDTEGAEAQDDFLVTYHGEPLNPNMILLVNNTLQYTLQLSEVEREESY